MLYFVKFWLRLVPPLMISTVRKLFVFLAQMEKFSTFFGSNYTCITSHFSETEQLCITLQGKDTTIQEAITAAHLAVNSTERPRQDSSLDDFYSGVGEASKRLTSSPALPRSQKPSRKPG